MVQPSLVANYLRHLQVLDFRKNQRAYERVKKAKEANDKHTKNITGMSYANWNAS
jgi:hypothetical protein